MTSLDQQVAAVLRAQADLLDPVVAPSTAGGSTGAGGTIVDPSGFTGRTQPSADFMETPAFEENWPYLAPKGRFADVYSKWSVYPFPWPTTDKKGVYDPANNLRVIDSADGFRCLEQRVKSANNSGRGHPTGAVVQAKWGSNGDGRTKGECVQARFKLKVPGPGGHFVPLGWPPRDSDWPKNGEPDYVEIDTNGSPKVSGWFHVQNGGSQGQGQVQLTSDVPATEWFVVKAERIPGKYYRWYLNGKLYKQVLAPGLSPSDTEKPVTTVLSGDYNIPQNDLRWPIQFESSGTNQTNDIVVYCDWWSIHQAA